MPWRELESPENREKERLLDRLFEHKAKYLVDESLGIGVYQIVKSLGHNVVYGPHIGLGGRSDQDVFAKA